MTQHLGYGLGRNLSPRIIIVCAITLFILLPATGYCDEVANLAKKLSELRGEVESLSNQLDLKQQQLKNELDSLAMQKAELQVQQKKEQMRVAELEAALKARKDELAKHQVSGDDLRPVLHDMILRTRVSIREGLPFKTSERLAELDKLENQMNSGVLRPEKVAGLLWAFLEDEFRLTRESAMDRQVITVNGKEELADVVRIGMVMMFYRTGGGEFGAAMKSDSSWRYEPITNSDHEKLVSTLFDSFKKQIRVGYFELPNGLPQ